MIENEQDVNPYRPPVVVTKKRNYTRLDDPKTLTKLGGAAMFLSMCPSFIVAAIGIIARFAGFPSVPTFLHPAIFGMFIVCGTLGVSISGFTFAKGLWRRSNRDYRTVIVMAPSAIVAGIFHVWLGGFVFPFMD